MTSNVGGSLVVDHFPAREQALVLLDKLCRDSLEIPLARVVAMTDRQLVRSDISSTFKWLHDLIVKEIQT